MSERCSDILFDLLQLVRKKYQITTSNTRNLVGHYVLGWIPQMWTNASNVDNSVKHILHVCPPQYFLSLDHCSWVTNKENCSNYEKLVPSYVDIFWMSTTQFFLLTEMYFEHKKIVAWKSSLAKRIFFLDCFWFYWVADPKKLSSLKLISSLGHGLWWFSTETITPNPCNYDSLNMVGTG